MSKSGHKEFENKYEEFNINDHFIVSPVLEEEEHIDINTESDVDDPLSDSSILVDGEDHGGEKQGTSRRSYSIMFKLKILSEYKPGVAGCGFLALAKRYGITTSTLRGWYNQKDKLNSIVLNRNKSIGSVCRVTGGGRKREFPEIEDMLVKWVKERNQQGLRVTGKYVQKMGIQYAAERSVNFKASSGWFSNFMGRHGLTTRRETTVRTLPADASSKAMDARKIIEAHKIKSEIL